MRTTIILVMPQAKVIQGKRAATKASSRAVKSPAKPTVDAGWIERKAGGVHVLQSAALARIPWLVHGFSTKVGGISDLDGEKILNLSFTEWDLRPNVAENRRRFMAALSANHKSEEMRLVALKQIHSDVVCAFEKASGDVPCKGDASITNEPGLLPAVQTADCVPILLVDPTHRAVAAIHAGWRGTLARIAAKTVGQLRMHFGSNPADLLAAIGPSIGVCCYEVGTEVATQFTSQFPDAADYFDELRTGDEPNPLQWLNMMPPGHQPQPKNVRLDLRKANRAQLLGSGLRDKSIFVSEVCTACRPDLFFSYRKQGPRSGRMLSAIGIAC